MGWVVGIVGLTATVTGTPKVKTCLLYFSKLINSMLIFFIYLQLLYIPNNRQKILLYSLNENGKKFGFP